MPCFIFRVLHLDLLRFPTSFVVLGKGGWTSLLKRARTASSAFLRSTAKQLPIRNPFEVFSRAAHTHTLPPSFIRDLSLAAAPYCSQSTFHDRPLTRKGGQFIHRWKPRGQESAWLGTLQSIRNESPPGPGPEKCPGEENAGGSTPLILWKELDFSLWSRIPEACVTPGFYSARRSGLHEPPPSWSSFSYPRSNVTASRPAGTQNAPGSG